MVWPFLFLVTSWILHEGAFDGITSWAAVNALLFPAVLLGSLALHELGHALFARAVGLGVPRIAMGEGEQIARWRWGKRRYSIGRFPFYGTSYFSAPPHLKGVRWRMWVAFAGGPLANLAALVVAIVLGDLSPSGVLWPAVAVSWELAPFEMLAFASVLLLPFNLIPSAYRFPGDGFWLFFLPRIPISVLEEVLRAHQGQEVQDCILDGDLQGAERQLQDILAREPSSRSARGTLALLRLHQNRPSEARTQLLELLADPAVLVKTTYRNNLAWANFMLDDPELRAEADEHSAAVLAHQRTAASLGARGAVLGWMGQHAEAVELLELAFAANMIPQYRALNACCLAISWSASGQRADALDWLDAARNLDPKSVLLERATAAINRAAEIRS